MTKRIEAETRERYLDLMKKCLTRSAFPERFRRVAPGGGLKGWAFGLIRPLLAKGNMTLVRDATKLDAELREIGADWPLEAETMVGLRRLDNIQACVERVIADEVPGDLIETGVWRGGAAIFMRAVLAAHGETERIVWAADSFEGLPPPAYGADAGDRHHTYGELAIPLEEVQANFRRYGFLDDQVRFLKGFFRDTLPGAPVERLALIRLDGDMYGSTMDALEALYPKLSVGGFVIVDDYGLKGAKEAVDEFRRGSGIADPIEEIDWMGAFWRRSS